MLVQGQIFRHKKYTFYYRVDTYVVDKQLVLSSRKAEETNFALCLSYSNKAEIVGIANILLDNKIYELMNPVVDESRLWD